MIIRRRTVWICALALAGALSIAGCGGDDDGAASPSLSPASSPPAAAGQAYTPEQLEAVLLTATDLGTDWTETQRGAFTTREPENPSVEQSLSLCPQAAEQAERLGELASDAGADVELEQATEGAAHMLRQQAWSDDQVQQYFTTLDEAITMCVGSSWEADGNEVSLEALEAPALGDESTSVAAVATLGEGAEATTWTSRLTVARFGTALMAVSDIIVGGPVPEPEWSTIVQTAGDQFAELAS